jgi:hypothetical protein
MREKAINNHLDPMVNVDELVYIRIAIFPEPLLELELM